MMTAHETELQARSYPPKRRTTTRLEPRIDELYRPFISAA